MNTTKWWNAFFMVGSMVLFFSLLWMVLSWERALIISGSLFFHEYGHIFAMQRYGMKVKGMYFIPFLGGAAVPASRMPSQESDVVISLAGPIFGLVLAITTAIAYALTGWTILGVAVVFMAILNLFNLVPVFPLDGGRVLSCIAHSVDTRIGKILMGGSVLLAGMLVFLFTSFLTLLIAFFAFTTLMGFLRDRPKRQRKLEQLEEIQRDVQEGKMEDLVSRGYIAMELRISYWKYGLKPPSIAELKQRLEEAIQNLREHPPLSARGIAWAAVGWVMIVNAFFVLESMVVDQAVWEGVVKFFSVP